MDSIARFLGAGSTKDPSRLRAQLSKEAMDLICQAFEGVGEVIDVHTHCAGVGHEQTGCRIHPNFYSLLHPILYVKRLLLLSAARVAPSSSTVDRDYIDSLVDMIKAARPFPWGRHFLLALDNWYDAAGRARPERTTLYVPNEYVCNVAEEFPDYFIPAISIHPFKMTAVAELEMYAKRGVKLVKWHPNSMGINLLHEACQPFYAKMREYGMALLVHCGYEHSLNAGGVDQDLGNPLYLKGPLDAGVRVIAAHCASEGESYDIEEEGRPRRPNFELFLRLMDRAEYRGLLYGDISSVTLFMRVGPALTATLDRTDLHHRLIFGTDYPLPAANMLVQTSQLLRKGYITAAERTLLNEIFAFNPLLFDFVLKRCLRSPEKRRAFDTAIFSKNIIQMGIVPPPKHLGASRASVHFADSSPATS